MKKNFMAKSVLLTAALMVFFLSGYTQNMTSEQAKDLKSRTLLVALNQPDEYEMKELTKEKKSTDEYKKIIENDDAALKNAVDKYWKFSTYKYMPKEEAFELVKKEPEKYALLSMARYIDYEHW